MTTTPDGRNMLYIEYGFYNIPVIESILALILLLTLAYKLISDRNAKISAIHPATLMATGLGVGWIPFIPGTFGSMFACLIIIDLSLLKKFNVIENANILFYLIPALTIFFYSAGVWASNVYMKRTGKEDPGEIIIDEIAGIFTATTLFMGFFIGFATLEKQVFFLSFLAPYYVGAGFLLFRLFDIWKPWVIGKLDRNIKGGHGVMLDDIVAGVFTALTMAAIFIVLFYTGIFTEIVRKIHPDWIESQPVEENSQ